MKSHGLNQGLTNTTSTDPPTPARPEPKALGPKMLVRASTPVHNISPQHSQWPLLLQQAAKRVWPEEPASELQTQRPICVEMPAQPHNACRGAVSATVAQEPRQRGSVQGTASHPRPCQQQTLASCFDDWDKPYLK